MKPIVLVIDDKQTFAVHVWRALSGALEFGRSHSQGTHTFDWEREDERLCVCWHDARSGPPLLEKRLPRSDAARAFVLLDLRLGASSAAWFSYKERLLEMGVSEARIFLVSSYAARHDWRSNPAEVLSKTPETLERLRTLLPECPAEPSSWDPGYLHVLVTGAGFELAADPSATGLPETWRILDAMGASWTDRARQLARGSPRNGSDAALPLYFDPAVEPSFPIPRGRLVEDAADSLAQAATDRDLDSYWEHLLGCVHRKSQRRAGESKVHLSQTELDLRETFRLAIAQYDIGHMSQSLIAATLPWTAWLTTNYTGFSTRAIERCPASTRPWKAVRTREEANVLRKERWHRAPNAEAERLFVRLHGDISQVRSMAVASSDKGAESSLGVTPNLADMYDAASLWLDGATRGRAVHWHIVGHGLYDRMLVQLLTSLSMDCTEPRQFTIVAPAPRAESIRTRFGPALSDAKTATVEVCNAPAEAYLRGLRMVAHADRGRSDS